jgi:hypothetical protein
MFLVGSWGESRRVQFNGNDAWSGLPFCRPIATIKLAAVVYATEEAIINTLIGAETMSGINGNTVYALPHERLRQVLRKPAIDSVRLVPIPIPGAASQMTQLVSEANSLTSSIVEVTL